MAVSMLRCEEDTARRDLRQDDNNSLTLSLSFSLSPPLSLWPYIKVFPAHESRPEITFWQGWRKTNLDNVSHPSQNSGTVKGHICVHLFPRQSNGCKRSYGSIRQRGIMLTIVRADTDRSLVTGHLSHQIKTGLTHHFSICISQIDIML